MVKWRTVTRVKLTENDNVDFKPFDEGSLTPCEEERAVNKVTEEAKIRGLTVDGLVDIIDHRRDYVVDPNTFDKIRTLRVRVDYVVATFHDKMDLNKFKLTNPDTMKICRIEED